MGVTGSGFEAFTDKSAESEMPSWICGVPKLIAMKNLFFPMHFEPGRMHMMKWHKSHHSKTPKSSAVNTLGVY